MKNLIFIGSVFLVFFTGCSLQSLQSLNVPEKSNKLFLSNNWEPINSVNKDLNKIVE